MAYTYGAGNPYLGLLERSLTKVGIECAPFRFVDVAQGRLDVLHLHWPESAAKGSLWRAVAATCKLVVILLTAKTRRVSIVWTVHNIKGHEVRHRRIETGMRYALSRLVDGWIAMSEESASIATESMPALTRAPYRVIPHGHYRDYYGSQPSQEIARRQLGIPPESRVVLFFGIIRQYKNVPALITAFSSMPEDWRLIIAGNVRGDLSKTIRKLGGDDQRIVLHLHRIADSDVPTLFAAADLCVFPFRNILNSGSAILALSLNTPVLVPALASLKSLHREVGEPWVQLYQGDLKPVELERAMERAFRLSGEPDLGALSWEKIGPATQQLYTELASRPDVNRPGLRPSSHRRRSGSG